MVAILSEIVLTCVIIELYIYLINQIYVIEILRVCVDGLLLGRSLLLKQWLRLLKLILLLLLLLLLILGLLQYLLKLVKENKIPSELHVAPVLIREQYVFEHIDKLVVVGLLGERVGVGLLKERCQESGLRTSTHLPG